MLSTSALMGFGSPDIKTLFTPQDIDGSSYKQVLQVYGNNKTLPLGFEKQALLALSFYPELKDVKIAFRFTKSGPPLQARPTVWSTLTRSAPNRTYLINIATKSHAMFEPILLENMEFNAQVGVLGHELAHISDFSKRSFWGMLGILLGNLSPQYLDKMEYATDDRTVVRGLGHQLLAWSTHVSTASETYFKENPGLVSKALQNVMENERYMTPTTIQKRMSELEIYQDGP